MDVMERIMKQAESNNDPIERYLFNVNNFYSCYKENNNTEQAYDELGNMRDSIIDLLNAVEEKNEELERCLEL